MLQYEKGKSHNVAGTNTFFVANTIKTILHSSLANPSIQFFHALYKYYPIKLLAEYREFNKMMGIIIQEEVWNTIEAYRHEMAKNELFLIKKAKLTTFLTLCQLW